MFENYRVFKTDLAGKPISLKWEKCAACLTVLVCTLRRDHCAMQRYGFAEAA